MDLMMALSSCLCSLLKRSRQSLWFQKVPLQQLLLDLGFILLVIEPYEAPLNARLHQSMEEELIAKVHGRAIELLEHLPVQTYPELLGPLLTLHAHAQRSYSVYEVELFTLLHHIVRVLLRTIADMYGGFQIEGNSN